MAWDFETDPEFQQQLDWIDTFVRNDVEPLDLLLGAPADVKNPRNIALIRPLQAKVKERNLWACHLGPELGGPGYGQLKLALMNEILGRSRFAPTVFGSQAPDSGNAEILAHFGTAEHKARFLQPLLANQIVSCFSMTEPHGGSDPLSFRTAAVRDGQEWVLNGEKWFSSNACFADFLIVMAVTDPDAASPYRRASMFIVPADTPGIEIVRNVQYYGSEVGGSAYIRYTNVRVPLENLLGERGGAFAAAQIRLGGGRIHHAMRTIGEARKALDETLERVVSRTTKNQRLADLQMVQEKIADSWMQLEQFRLLVLRTAWLIDRYKDYRRVRKDIAAVKVLMPKVLHDIAERALHLHGSLGVSTEMPYTEQIVTAYVMGLADGPTEIHKITLAEQLLKDVQPSTDLFPSYHLPRRHEAAIKKYGHLLDAIDGEI